MKKIINILSFTFSLMIYAQSVSADNICYDVEGEIRTNNISPAQQMGNIELSLTNQVTGEEVSLEGDLIGTIIGVDETGAVLLSHTATSNDEEQPFTFVTFNDRAEFVGAIQGCNVPVSETITNIVGGSGFTANVTFVDILVNGSVNVVNVDECLGVPNVFEDVSGEVCVDQ